MESVVDIIKHAIENEVRAMVFYRRAGELSNVGESQMVFIELVEMEELHGRVLADKFKDLLAAGGVDSHAYLTSLEVDADTTLGEEGISLLKDANIRPVLDFAIAMELRAKENYQGLAKRIEGDDMRAFCLELADEEQDHADMLTEARKGLDTPEDDRPML